MTSNGTQRTQRSIHSFFKVNSEKKKQQQCSSVENSNFLHRSDVNIKNKGPSCLSTSTDSNNFVGQIKRGSNDNDEEDKDTMKSIPLSKKQKGSIKSTVPTTRRTSEEKSNNERQDEAVDSNQRQTSVEHNSTSEATIPTPISIGSCSGTNENHTVSSFAYSSKNCRQKPQSALSNSRHEQFALLLKRQDSLYSHVLRGRSVKSISEQVDNSAESDQEEPTATKKSVKSKDSVKKLTPLEKQVIQLKNQYMDTILMFEVGYKYRLFGKDAAIACSEFGWYLVQGKLSFDQPNNDPVDSLYDKFASCSFPTHRLEFYIKRLVDRGHKVGVISQIETAALKAVSTNKSGPFERKLTRLYTKGTYVDEFHTDRDSSKAANNNAPSGYLMAICEDSFSSSSGSNNNIRFGIIATHASSGDIIFDDFEDTNMLHELETRLLHIQPCEIIIVGEISSITKHMLDKLIASYEVSSRIRFQKVDRPLSYSAAFSFVSDYYTQQIMDSLTESNQVQGTKKLQSQIASIENLPKSVILCLSSLIQHLMAFKIDKLFLLTNNFSSFSSTKHMLLNGNTLSCLEIFRNETDYTEHGSLFWVLDHTRTQFGQRLLKKWVGKPLIDREELELRNHAITELKSKFDSKIDAVSSLMKRLPDLEKGLINIHYKRQTYFFLYYMSLLSQIYEETDATKVGFESSLLNNLFSVLPTVRNTVAKLLSQIAKDAAISEIKEDYFLETVDGFEEIEDQKVLISETDHKLEAHLADLKKLLKKPHLKFTTVAGLSHLIELKSNELKTIPNKWLKMSATKTVSRFRSPETIDLLKELDRGKERLVLACDRIYNSFLNNISQFYEEFRQVIQVVGQLDCLMSLAAVSNQTNYCCPQYVDSTILEVEEGRHPMVEHLLSRSYIPNDIDMRHDKDRVLVITGPNMGGKSSYVRQVALICIMAQIGCYVPAKSAKIGILDAIYTRMGAYDNMLNGESTFMVELQECSDIIKSATKKSLVILDEIGRGTSTIDGVAIAHSVLSFFISEIQALTLFVTHYPLVSSFEKVYPGIVSNYHMGFIENNEQEDKLSKITFLYRLVYGMANKSFGLNVARIAGIPSNIIDVARNKSQELERTLTITRGKNSLRDIEFITAALSSQLEHDEIVEAILHLQEN